MYLFSVAALLQLRLAIEALHAHPGTGRLWAILIQLLAVEQDARNRRDLITLEPSFNGKGPTLEVKVWDPDRPQLDVFAEALSHVPKSGEVWCEGARLHLNPHSPRFSLTVAHQFLEFALQFTPQYGDSFLELLKLLVLKHAGLDSAPTIVTAEEVGIGMPGLKLSSIVEPNQDEDADAEGDVVMSEGKGSSSSRSTGRGGGGSSVPTSTSQHSGRVPELAFRSRVLSPIPRRPSDGEGSPAAERSTAASVPARTMPTATAPSVATSGASESAASTSERGRASMVSQGSESATHLSSASRGGSPAPEGKGAGATATTRPFSRADALDYFRLPPLPPKLQGDDFDVFQRLMKVNTDEVEHR